MRNAFRMKYFLICTLVSACLPQLAHAADWSQWRGPTRQGISPETGLLDSWPATGLQRVWLANGLGDGYAGVVVSNGRVFTMSRRESDVFAVALNAKTGQQLWETRIGTTSRIPSSTPTVDASRIYYLDPDGDLVCLSVETGKEIWQRHFIEEFGETDAVGTRLR